MSRELLQQAHDALLALISEIADTHPMAGFDEYDSDAFKHACAVERTLRAALAAPQGEPMAWAKRNGIKVVLTTCPPDDLDGWISLYAAPSGEEAGNGKS